MQLLGHTWNSFVRSLEYKLMQQDTGNKIVFEKCRLQAGLRLKEFLESQDVSVKRNKVIASMVKQFSAAILGVDLDLPLALESPGKSDFAKFIRRLS